MRKIIRVPRPHGVTIEMIEIRSLDNDALKKQRKKTLVNNIIKSYINNGFKLNNKQYSFNELSMFLNVSIDKIIKRSVRGETLFMGGGKGIDSIQGLGEVLLGKCFFDVTKDRYLIETQTDMLIKKQKNRYVPYLSAEVNRAIKTQIDSNSVLIDLYKAIVQGTQTKIQILNTQNNFTNNTANTNHISVLEAIEMMDGRALPPAENAIAISESYVDDNLPNIIAKEKNSGTRGKALPYRLVQNEIDNAIEAEPILS